MYKYKSKENRCVRFRFDDGRVVNLLGTEVKITIRETATQPEHVKVIPAATQSDFEEILSNQRYQSLHSKIYQESDKEDSTITEEKPKPVKKPKRKYKKSTVNKSDVSDNKTLPQTSDSE